MLIKLQFTHNTAMLDIVNNGAETIIFKPEEMIGIVDLRLLYYYKIKQVYYNKILASITGLKEQKHSVNISINL